MLKVIVSSIASVLDLERDDHGEWFSMLLHSLFLHNGSAVKRAPDMHTGWLHQTLNGGCLFGDPYLECCGDVVLSRVKIFSSVMRVRFFISCRLFKMIVKASGLQ